MKKKRDLLKRGSVVLLSVVMLLGVGNFGTPAAWAAPASGDNSAAAPAQGGFVSDDNGYIKYYVNNADGSFYVMPSTQAFDAGKPASFTLFRIGGQTYRFGDATEGAQGLIPPQKNADGTTQTTWYVQDYAITQYLNIIQEDNYVDSYAVYAGYSIRYDGPDTANTASAEIAALPGGSQDVAGGGRVDARIVLDTQFGPKDDQPVLAQGRDNPITNETEISPAPQYYQTDETVANEGPYAYGQLTDSRFASPAALTVARFQNLANGGFDYKPDASTSFTSAADPGIALDFSADLTGKQGDADAVTIGTIYGFRGLTNAAAADETAQAAEATVPESDEQAAEPATKAVSAKQGITPMSADNPGVFDTVSGVMNDGVGFPDILYRGIYFGTYKHALKTPSIPIDGGNYYGNYTPSSYETRATPILWKPMGEETSGDAGDGYLIFKSVDAIDSLPFDTGGSAIYAGSSIQKYLDGTAASPPTPNTEPNPNRFTDNFLPGELGAVAPVTVITGNYANVAGYAGSVANQPFYLSYSSSGSDGCTASDSNNYVPFPNSFAPIYVYTYSVYLKNGLANGDPYLCQLMRSESMAGRADRAFETVSTTGLRSVFRAFADPTYHSGISPNFKLNPSNLIDAAAVGGSGDSIYTEGSAYKLTVLGAGNGTDVGSFGISGEPTTPLAYEPQNNSHSFSFAVNAQPNYAVPANPDPGSYSINYKIAGNVNVNGVRSIVQRGSDSDISDTTFSIDYSNLQPGKTYDVYVWLQRNSADGSNEATAPQHFPITVQRASYAINTSFYHGGSLSYTDATHPSGPYASGDTITLSGVTIPDPSANKFQLNVYLNKNGAKANVELTDNGDGTYSFVMPPNDVEVHLDVFAKGSPTITVQPNPNGGVTLDPPGGTPGTVIQVTAQNTDPDYYVAGAQFFATQSVMNQATGQTSIQETPIAGADISFVAGGVGSFNIPIDIGSSNILVKVLTAPLPVNPVTLPASLNLSLGGQSYTVALAPDGGDSAWANSGGVWSTGKFKPGQQASIRITPAESFWGFDVTSVALGGTALAYTENIYNFGGLYADTVTFTMPAFTGLSNWTDGDVHISLTPKKFYQPYSVASVTPDAGAFANFTSFAVTGTELEQITGQGINFAMLTTAQQAQARTVTFGSNPQPNLNQVIPASNVALRSDGSLLVTPPPALLQSLVGANGTFYLTLGNTTRTVTLDMNYRLRYTPFGVLGVVENGSHSYAVELGDSDADLAQRAGGNQIVLKMKGTVAYDQGTGAYSFKQGQATLGNIVVYSLPADGGLTVSASGGTVTISGKDGTLSLPGFNTGVPMPVSCTVQKGTAYRDDVFAQKSDKFKNVTISWNYTAPGAAKKGLKIATMLGMTAQANDIRLMDSSVAFGGTLDLNLPENLMIWSTAGDNSIVNIAMQQLQYGLNSNGLAVFQGVRASGDVQLPNDFQLSFLDFNTEAHASVDTFSNNYHLDGNINFHVFEAQGGITLKPSCGYPIPDEVNLFIASDPGVPIIPAILQLQGVGGGVSGIADTINGNFGYIPPFTLSTQGRLSIIELIDYDGGGTIGPSEYSGHGAVSVSKGAFSLSLGQGDWGLYNYDDGSIVSAGMQVDLVSGFTIISGGGNVSIGYRSQHGGFQFSGSLYATVQIPRFKVIFWYGPYTIGSVNCGLDNKGARGSVKLLGLFSFGVSYNWGDSKPGVSLLSADTTPKPGDSLATTQPVYRDGKYVGSVSFGTNLKLVEQGSAEKVKAGISPLDLAAGDGVNPTVQQITIGANQFATTDIPRADLQVYYTTDGGAKWQPYDLYFPRAAAATDDDPYTDSELNAAWVNALDQSNGSETSIMLKLDPAISTTWRLVDTAGGSFNYDVVEATPIPELTGATLSGGTLNWSAQGLDPTQPYTLDVSLTRDDGSAAGSGLAQYPVVLNQPIPAGSIVGGKTAGSVTLDPANFPANLPSGDYHAVVYLNTWNGTSDLLDANGQPIPDGNGGTLQQTNATADSLKYTAETLNYANPKQPADVQSLDATAAGNGALKAAWTGVGSDVYYQITAYDSGGNPVKGPPQTVTDANGNPQTITQPYIYNVTPEMYGAANAAGPISATLTGLPAGADYRLEITPYRYADPADTTSAAVMGGPTQSDLVNLPVPNYPKVSATFEGAVTSTDGQNNFSVYASSDYKVNLSSDQNCHFTMTEDGNFVYQSASPESSLTRDLPLGVGAASRYVVIQAVNAAGDIGYFYYNAYYDNVKPTLFIDTKNGSITADANGKFVVTGSTKPGAMVSLYLGGQAPVQAGADGSFRITGTLSSPANMGVSSLSAAGIGNSGGAISALAAPGAGATLTALADSGGTLVTVGSTDAVGNTTTANVNVLAAGQKQGGNGGKGGSHTQSATSNSAAKTGDSSNAALWLALLAASVLGSLFVRLLRRRLKGIR